MFKHVSVYGASLETACVGSGAPHDFPNTGVHLSIGSTQQCDNAETSDTIPQGGSTQPASSALLRLLLEQLRPLASAQVASGASHSASLPAQSRI